MPKEYADNLIEFSAKVSKADYEEFIGYLPIHGSTAWLIRNALKEINNKLRADPTLTERLREAIAETTRV
jgi:hypothetical protein